MLNIAIVISIFTLPFLTCCPFEEKIRPCICKPGNQDEVSCPGLENEQVLIDAVYALRTTKTFYSFTITNGTFRFIPHDAFKGIKFQELKIISSSLMSLTDTDIAFEGLEDSLISLIITDSYFLNEWDWEVLKNLKKIIKLHIEANLNIIAEDIELISSLDLKDISFANNYITEIHDNAFASFKEIMSISLKNNAIQEVKRSMMPNPAPLLWKLDFSRNALQQLPANLFENMPSLTTLDLTSNKLLTLSEKPLSEIWERLDYFDAEGNSIRCDCRLLWMTKLRYPKNVNAACDQPMNLHGKSLLDIKERDLWC